MFPFDDFMEKPKGNLGRNGLIKKLNDRVSENLKKPLQLQATLVRFLKFLDFPIITKKVKISKSS